MKKLLRKLGFQEFATLDWKAFPEAERFLNGDGPYIRTYPSGAIVVDKNGILAESWSTSGEPFEISAITNLYAAHAWVLITARIRHWQPSFVAVASFPGAKQPEAPGKP